MDTTDRGRYLANLQDEIDGAFLYRIVAAAESSPELAEVYRRLAEVEERHAAFWRDRLAENGSATSGQESLPSRRARLLGWLARRFGPSLVLPVLASDEQRARGMYDDQPETAGTGMRGDERSHARVLRTIQGGGVDGAGLARLEGRHRSIGSNALRAAILGANDGLVSNLSLVMGVAGAVASAELGPETIVLSGMAGLVAGAFSMAMGEWISVQGSRESVSRQLQIESDELEAFPEEEAEELRLIYQAKGLPAEQAKAVADRLLADPTTALDVMAREELGIDPDELGGSPWQAAITSFVLFALGAIIPVIPFLVSSGVPAIVTSVIASAVGLFALGAAITLFTGRGVLFAGTRQTAIGLGAAIVTYGVGTLLGVSVAG